MLFQFGQLLRLIPGSRLPALLLLLLLRVLGLPFAEDLLEWADLDEIHVARGAPEFAIGSNVIGPHKIRKELIGLQGKLLQLQEMIERALFVGGGRLAQLHEFGFLACHGVGQTIGAQAEVIPGFPLKGQLFQWRNPLIATRRRQLQFGRAICERLEHKLRRHFIGPPLGIDQLQRVSFAGIKREAIQADGCFVGVGKQRDH